jgi:superfamily II DNA or RNA helicase
VHAEMLEKMEPLSPLYQARGLQVSVPQLKAHLAKLEKQKKTDFWKKEYEAQLHAFLKAAWEQNVHLAYGLQREALVHHRLLTFQKNLRFKAAFTREKGEFSYCLQAWDGDKRFELNGNPYHKVLQEPGWVISGMNLIYTAELKGSLLQPFSTKSEILLKPEMLRTYLQGFFRKLLEEDSLEVSYSGLPVLRYTKLERISVGCEFNELLGAYVVTPYFHYGTHKVPVYRNRAVICLPAPAEELRYYLVVIERDKDAERKGLHAFDLPELEKLQNGAYRLSAEAARNMTEWVNAFSQRLEAEASFSGVEHQGKKMLLEAPQFHVNSERRNDFFDVFIELEVGAHRFPFSNLIPFLNSGNRIFPLGENEFFQIPEAWFHRLQPWTTLYKNRKGVWEIPASAMHSLESFDAGFKQKKLRGKPDWPEGLPETVSLRPYQQFGLDWLKTRFETGRGALLADDMGLGKTVQVLSFLYALHESREKNGADGKVQVDLFSPAVGELLPALVVVPTSLVENWRREAIRFFPDFRVLVHSGSGRQKSVSTWNRYHIVLTTYGTLRADQEMIGSKEFSCLVVDEAQMLKNYRSRTYKAVQSVNAPFSIALTGTPVENSLMDLWSIFYLLEPGMLGGKQQFKSLFNGEPEKVKNNFTWLRKNIAPAYLRRTKQEVAKELPELIRRVQYVPMLPEQAELYEKEKSAVRNEIISRMKQADSKSQLSALRAITRLRQLANHPALISEPFDSGKFERVLKDLETLILADKKILVFSPFTSHLDLYRAALDERGWRHSSLTGSTPASQRQQVVDRFIKDKSLNVLLMSLKAGGVGLNLVAADYVLILDPWWNPQAEEQALSRAHRMGRKAPVTVCRYISLNTLEERIFQIQNHKRSLAREALPAPVSHKDLDWSEVLA